MKDILWKQRLDPEEDAQICPNCGKVYVIVRRTTHSANNVFGYIRCLSCGMYTEV